MHTTHRGILAMIDRGDWTPRLGQFIDGYNRTFSDRIAGTITTRVDSSNHYYVIVKEKKSGCAAK